MKKLQFHPKAVAFILLAYLGLVANGYAQKHDANHAMPNVKSEASTETKSTNQATINANGIIKAIDVDTKKLTIEHEPIPSVNWPAMTMRFTFENPAMIENIKVGSKINFDFVQEGALSMLRTIKITQ